MLDLLFEVFESFDGVGRNARSTGSEHGANGQRQVFRERIAFVFGLKLIVTGDGFGDVALQGVGHGAEIKDGLFLLIGAGERFQIVQQDTRLVVAGLGGSAELEEDLRHFQMRGNALAAFAFEGFEFAGFASDQALKFLHGLLIFRGQNGGGAGFESLDFCLLLTGDHVGGLDAAIGGKRVLE